MKSVFSSHVISETVLVRDALLEQGIAALIPSEYSGLSAVPEFRPPGEVWISRPEDYDKARRIVTEVISRLDNRSESASWVCSACSEDNPGSFDTCWKCGAARRER